MKLGFIGTGNMAGAIMGGIIKRELLPRKRSSVQILWKQDVNVRKKEHGIHVTADNIEVTQKAEVLVSL